MVIDEYSLEKVNGATIDYKTDLNNEGFVIMNPNVPEVSEIQQRIVSHLDSTINPMIASHGGKIDVVRVENGVLYIEMKVNVTLSYLYVSVLICIKPNHTFKSL